MSNGVGGRNKISQEQADRNLLGCLHFFYFLWGGSLAIGVLMALGILIAWLLGFDIWKHE